MNPIRDGVVVIDDRYDHRARWSAGERLHDLVTTWARERPAALAVDPADGAPWTVADLVAAARRLALRLRALGVARGDRVAILVDRPERAYVAMIAVSRAGAAYVPLDPAFPPDRSAFILADAGVRTAVTVTALADRLTGPDAPPTELVLLDGDDAPGDTTGGGTDEPPDELPDELPDEDRPDDDLAYVVYTSGTSGRPKGVAVAHSAIVNFVRVAAELYGYRPDDRVYQGMTIAFDFSVEELWVPWAAGAAVVPRPAGTTLVGDDLERFLRAQRVTALACVPTLLATLDPERLDALRLLLVSGEACPQDLVLRWHREGRRFLNVYGPTEATVTATWGEVHPDRPVTLGRPLPTYSVAVLEPDTEAAVGVAPGELGEIAIGGIGLAREYVNLPERTARAFVPDTLGAPHNPSGRLYRTGDLGRVTEDGEIEYHGRIDTQVKVRGYRIELTEIESVMLAEPGVAAAVVSTWEPVAGMTELAGWFSVRAGHDPAAVRAGLRTRLRDRLPPYMVPRRLSHLDVVPLTTNDKADRAALPPPTDDLDDVAAERVAPATPTEDLLTAALAEALGVAVGGVSVTAHVLDDLGANSLLLARFSAAARRAGVAASIVEIYRAPSVRTLAALVDAREPDRTGAEAPAVREPHRATTAAVAATGAAQLLLFVGYLWVFAAAVAWAYDLVAAGEGLAELVVQALLTGVVGFGVLALGPVAAKWVLLGRCRETEFAVWTPRYLRFWLVRTLVRANVMIVFAGTPLYNVYLRALGARVGRRAVVLTRQLPVAADLLTVGEDAVVRKGVLATCYAVEGGRIRTGPVSIGARAFVGESCVLDPGSAIGDDAQLGHAGSLHAGARVPDGARWHGSPAVPAPEGSEFQRVGTARVTTVRRAVHGAAQLAQVVGIVVPLAVLAAEAAVSSRVGAGAQDVPPPSTAAFWLDALVISAALFAGVLAVGLLAALTLPRLLRLLVRPGRTYPLYGLGFAVQRGVSLVSNRPFFNSLFGDSALVTRYLGGLGWQLGLVEQTGSNFGTTQAQEDPLLCRVGRGTMVSDGLSMANAEFSSTAFRLVPVEIGARNFLGNRVLYPAGGRTGDNVLLATKVMVPLDGPVHRDTGLLGSPAFTIPRSVERDTRVPRPGRGLEMRAALRAKRRHNLPTMAGLLFARWGQVFLATVSGLLAAVAYPSLGSLAVALGLAATILVGTAWLVLCERAAFGFRALRPRFCSIHDPYFWCHERLWKLLVPALTMFDGTPFKSWVLRALGVRVGRRLVDDGAVMPEHGLVSLGDDVTLGLGSTIQCHSLEDGLFKSDRTHLDHGATVGTGAFVHYGVHLGAGAVLDADSFLMKGTTVPAGARWRGNPAVQCREPEPSTTDTDRPGVPA